MNIVEPLRHPYEVSVTSGFGSLVVRNRYFDYCRQTFGRKRSVWDMASYQWNYRFCFKNEADATMFALRWCLPNAH